MEFYLEKKDLFGFYKEVKPMKLRKKIDDIDGRIIDLFVERFSIVMDI